MATLRKQIQDNFKRLEELKRQIGIRPKMNVIKCTGCELSSFDLRSLNKNLIKKW